MTQANTAYSNPVSDPGLPNGTTLSGDQFTITRRLSAGGFGITYLAEDNTLGRTIVIKECYPDDLCLRNGTDVIVRNAAQMKQFRSIVDMFMREARSLAKLRHPNIVGVHRAFEENETAYMALDLIDGHDMLDILESGPNALPSPERVKDILIQLLHAIEAVHDRDLLHRDISPDNIIIEKTGTPVLIDFGAARGDASRRTRAISSMLVVKDGYSPQEFYLAGSIQTPSSDLYALGATFYHVLTGEAPPNSQIRMAEVASQNPDPCVPLAGRIEGYEPAFLEAIDTAMEVVPRKRLQSAAYWRGLITDEVAGDAHGAQAITTAPPKPMTQDIERLLTRLIQETNEEVEKFKPAEVEPETPEPEITPAEAKPEWLEEFNEESRRKEAVSQQLEALADQDDAPEDDASTLIQVRKVTDRAAMDKVHRTRTRVIHSPPVTRPVEQNNAVRAKQKKDRELLRLEEERQAVNAQFRANTRIKYTSKRLGNDDSDVFGSDLEGAQLIGPLAKYLITGVVIGLGIVLMYPNFM